MFYQNQLFELSSVTFICLHMFILHDNINPQQDNVCIVLMI